jgi:hypothetical protein
VSDGGGRMEGLGGRRGVGRGGGVQYWQVEKVGGD